jgi:hypothetical protein
MSIELATDTIPRSGDTLQIKLIRPPSNLPAVLITWPAAPNITDASPRAIANVAAAAVRVWAKLNTRSGVAEGRLGIKITWPSL